MIFPSQKLNFWHIGCMLGASVGLPGTFFGHTIAKQYGAGTAITSIILGNLIVWTIAFSIIFISTQKKCSTADLARESLGEWGAITALGCLILGLVGWFAVQTDSAATTIVKILHGHIYHTKDFGLRIGAVLGLIVTLLATGGIQMIRRCCVFALPFLLLFSIYLIIKNPLKINFSDSWGFSLAATTIVAASVIPGTIYYPVIFRHSRSKADSFLAISIMTISTIIIECSYVCADFDNFIIDKNSGPAFIISCLLALIFLLLSYMTINLINIYLAIGSWTDLIKSSIDGRVYAVGGLVGTITYIFIQLSAAFYFFQSLISGFLINLGLVLLVSVLINKVVKHRPIVSSKLINSASWMAGCATSLMTQIRHPEDSYSSIINGIGVTLLAFILILFVEEILWAIKQGRKEGPSWH